MTAKRMCKLFDPIAMRTRAIVSRGVQFQRENRASSRYDNPTWKTAQLESGGVVTTRSLTIEEVESHLRGNDTYGWAPAELTRIGIIDIDTKAVETDEIARSRFDRLRHAFACNDIEPVASSSPSGGYYLYVTTAAPVPRAEFGRWLRDFVAQALGKELLGGVDIFPSSSGGDAAVRLPCGLGYSKRTGELVECRLLGPCHQELTASREDDINELPRLLDDAVVDLEKVIADPAALGYVQDEQGRWQLPDDAPIVAEARERAAAALRGEKSFPETGYSRGSFVAPRREDGALGVEDLIGLSWMPTIKRMQTGEAIDGSEGLFTTVRHLSFYHYVTEARSADDTVARLKKWAETYGHDAREIQGMVRRAINEFDARIKKSDIKPGLKTTVELIGLDTCPRRVVPRLLRQDAVLDRILDRVEHERLKPVAREILEHLRGHGTISQSRIEEIEGAGGQITVRAEEAGEVALQRAGDPDKKVRARVGVTARNALMRAKVLRKLRNYSTFSGNKRSSIYGIDYEELLAIRHELGLDAIVEEVEGKLQLIDCPNDVIEIVVTSPGDTITDESGVPRLRAKAITRELLKGVETHLVSLVPDELRSEAEAVLLKIGEYGTMRTTSVTPELVAALAPYITAVEDDRYGLAYGALRALRRELGLPLPRVRLDTTEGADSVSSAQVAQDTGTQPSRTSQDPDITPILDPGMTPMRTRRSSQEPEGSSGVPRPERMTPQHTLGPHRADCTIPTGETPPAHRLQPLTTGALSAYDRYL